LDRFLYQPNLKMTFNTFLVPCAECIYSFLTFLDECPSPDWIIFQEACYLEDFEERLWYETQEYCDINCGGSHVSILSEEENVWVAG